MRKPWSQLRAPASASVLLSMSPAEVDCENSSDSVQNVPILAEVEKAAAVESITTESVDEKESVSEPVSDEKESVSEPVSDEKEPVESCHQDNQVNFFF